MDGQYLKRGWCLQSADGSMVRTLTDDEREELHRMPPATEKKAEPDPNIMKPTSEKSYPYYLQRYKRACRQLHIDSETFCWEAFRKELYQTNITEILNLCIRIGAWPLCGLPQCDPRCNCVYANYKACEHPKRMARIKAKEAIT